MSIYRSISVTLVVAALLPSGLCVSKSSKRHTKRLVQSVNVPFDRSVNGLCSASQDAIGILSSCVSSGITTLTQCAQYGKDSSSSAANYVSFSASEDKCMWFTDCACLASSSTCLGGNSWNSVAISDVIAAVASPAIQTTAQTSSTRSSLVTETSPTTTTTNDLTDPAYCDESTNDLMQHFQSACALSQNIWYTRKMAGFVIAGILAVVIAAYAVAYKLDQDELRQKR